MHLGVQGQAADEPTCRRLESRRPSLKLFPGFYPGMGSLPPHPLLTWQAHLPGLETRVSYSCERFCCCV